MDISNLFNYFFGGLQYIAHIIVFIIGVRFLAKIFKVSVLLFVIGSFFTLLSSGANYTIIYILSKNNGFSYYSTYFTFIGLFGLIGGLLESIGLILILIEYGKQITDKNE
ncbi:MULTISPECIES: hypothetical protein [Chitinophagaceae]